MTTENDAAAPEATTSEKTEQEKKYEGLSMARQVVMRLSEEIGKVAEERGKSYGDPEDNFVNIVSMWNAYLRARFGDEYSKKYPLHPYDVGYFNVLQKMARLGKTPLHPDSALDAMNYAGLGLGVAMWEDQMMANALKEYFEKLKAQAEAQAQKPSGGEGDDPVSTASNPSPNTPPETEHKRKRDRAVQ